jgi:transcription antitermination factor NusG
VAILQTDGVVRLVGTGIRPSPIPDEQIDWIRIAGGKPSSLKREAHLFTGARVRVVGGPFTGIEGYVLVVKDSMRVVLSVDCIGQSLSIEVTPELVTKLPS